MSKIAVLDDNMINMIAAGEVIERPASVVKELLENSIDAGATKVVIEVEQGGRDLIRIIDNGSGMDADDLALAFEPHATSKIRVSDDLFGIRTMGFRGGRPMRLRPTPLPTIAATKARFARAAAMSARRLRSAIFSTSSRLVKSS
ncbi:MAG: ATP-binding protein [Planctomycetota bacterium]|jgi:hypothetical protein